MCTNPEKKKLLNINNLIAEIQKIKGIKKEIALTNSKKKNCFYKEMTHNGQHFP